MTTFTKFPFLEDGLTNIGADAVRGRTRHLGRLSFVKHFLTFCPTYSQLGGTSKGIKGSVVAGSGISTIFIFLFAGEKHSFWVWTNFWYSVIVSWTRTLVYGHLRSFWERKMLTGTLAQGFAAIIASWAWHLINFLIKLYTHRCTFSIFAKNVFFIVISRSRMAWIFYKVLTCFSWCRPDWDSWWLRLY